MQRISDIITGVVFMMAVFVLILVYPPKRPKDPPDTK